MSTNGREMGEWYQRTYSKIELSTADIVAGVGRLHNHGLAFDLGAGEGKFVAGTAGRVVVGRDGGEAVGKVVIDGPRGLRGAHVRCASVTAGLGGHTVGKGLVVDVAGLDGAGEAGSGPRTRWLTAVPTTGSTTYEANMLASGKTTSSG